MCEAPGDWLYLWVGLIVMAEGVQVSSSGQLPQQLSPFTPGFFCGLAL